MLLDQRKVNCTTIAASFSLSPLFLAIWQNEPKNKELGKIRAEIANRS